MTGAVRNHDPAGCPHHRRVRSAPATNARCGRRSSRRPRTPPAIIARLNRETTAVLNDPEVRAAFAKHGVEPEPGSPEALGARIRDDVKKWREVITSAGIREN